MITSRWIVVAVGVLATTALAQEPPPQPAPGEPEPPAPEPPPELEITFTTRPEVVVKDVEATLVLTITPREDLVLHPQTPFKAELAAPDDISLTKAAFTKTDFVDPEAHAKTIETPLVAKALGAHTIEAKLSFFLCSKKVCQRHRTTAALAIDVVETAPDPEPAPDPEAAANPDPDADPAPAPAQ